MALKKPAPGRIKRLRAVSEAHDEWVKNNLDQVEMNPEKSHKGSDYNILYLDIDAPAEVESKFQAAVRKHTNDRATE